MDRGHISTRSLWKGGSILLCISCQVLLLVTGCVSRPTRPEDNEAVSVSNLGVFPGEEDVLEGRAQQEMPSESDKQRGIDPQTSWRVFLDLQSSEKKKEQKKCKRRKKNGRLTGFQGPQGPPGPVGPPGPAGAILTKEDILLEFRSMIRGAAERRAQILVHENCPSCVFNITEPLSPEMEDLLYVPSVPVAFHCKLESDLRVSKKSLIEIDNFQTNNSKGLFERGNGLDVRTGRFIAPRTAIYQFSANIHIRHKIPESRPETRAEVSKRAKEGIRLMICIDSLCDKNASLEFISGLESRSRIFTISVSGLLSLQLSQYVSIYIDNNSSQKIDVQAGSDFTGLLTGV